MAEALSGLSRSTVSALENGTINDLSLTSSQQLLEALGLSLSIPGGRLPHNAPRGGHVRRPMAAGTANVSYSSRVTGNEIKEALLKRVVPPQATAKVAHFPKFDTSRGAVKTDLPPIPSELPHTGESGAGAAAHFDSALAKAMQVFGSKVDAERWMIVPAMGLDYQRPIDLLQTAQGAKLVADFLGHLEYGVDT